MLLELLHELVASLILPLLAQDDGSLHYHTSHIIGHSGDGTFDDGRMGHQRRLHLEGADAIA